MRITTSPAQSFLLLALLCCLAAAAFAQQQSGSPSPAPEEPAQDVDDEVIKVNTAIIQTGVAVFDKKGNFVPDLKLEDFELEVDGKPVAVSFFEANTGRRAPFATPARDARGAAATAAVTPVPASAAGRGRNVIFVVDDIHLGHESHQRVRKMILNFVENEMTADDTVAVVSSSGKIGFLQQFTNDRAALRAAVSRMRLGRNYSADDRTPPPMTEYEALLVDQYDPQVTDVFAGQDVAQGLGTDVSTAREMVRSRARIILSHAASISRATYSTLEQAVRNSARLPGRKLVFFISDGWLLDRRNTDATYRLRRITDAAARTNAVIYSIDPKGLEAGFPEGTSGSPQVGFRVQSGERLERQDGLNYLADETGGRFMKNVNDLQPAFSKSLEEAAQYYLLAWRPVTENGGEEKWRKIDVKVRNRPDLKVRVHGGFLDRNPKAELAEGKKAEGRKTDAAQPAVPPAERELNAAATAALPARSLPVAVNVTYLDLPEQGTSVSVALQIQSDAVDFAAEAGGQQKANIDVLGLVYDADGKRQKYFRELLTVEAAAGASVKAEGRQPVYHTFQAKLPPGLYQVRVAARDAKSGRTGSAVQWVEIPDLAARRLATSSLILSERSADPKTIKVSTAADAASAATRIAVDRRVARNSHLRYLTFIYNASRGKAGTEQPDVTVQTRLMRAGAVVVNSPATRISVEGKDPDRLPYAAEISLDKLPAGSYELVVAIQDRIAKAESTQRVSFEIK